MLGAPPPGFMGFSSIYTPNAVHFDGAATADYYFSATPPTGAVDGKLFTLSFWYKFQSEFSENATLFCTANNVSGLSVGLTDDDGSFDIVNNLAGTQGINMYTGVYAKDGFWHHLLASVDMTDQTKCKVYFDDVDCTNHNVSVVNKTLDYTQQFLVNGWPGDLTGQQACDLSDFWFSTTWMDLTSSANRRKFISATLKPVNLGSTGATPTGTAPLFYFGNPAASFATNLGTGGNLTAQESTSLIAATTNPKDAQSAYRPTAVFLEGTTTADYFRSANPPTGAVDGKQGLLSFWYRWKALASGDPNLMDSAGLAMGSVTATGKIGVYVNNVTALDMWTSISVNDGNWHHLLFAWDVAVGSTACKVYVDNVSRRDTGGTYTNATIDYTTQWHINEWTGGLGAAQGQFDWADFWFDTSWLDISLAANRRKFITTGLKPVFLGSDGSAPAGFVPLFYFNNAAATWGTNLGTGGNWTAQESTALTNATTNPAD